MEHRIQALDPRDLDVDALCELDWRAKICLYFHGSSCGEVQVHGTAHLSWFEHVIHDILLEFRRERTFLCDSDAHQLVDDVGYQRLHSNFLYERRMRRSFEEDTDWVK